MGAGLQNYTGRVMLFFLLSVSFRVAKSRSECDRKAGRIRPRNWVEVTQQPAMRRFCRRNNLQRASKTLPCSILQSQTQAACCLCETHVIVLLDSRKNTTRINGVGASEPDRSVHGGFLNIRVWLAVFIHVWRSLVPW